MPILNGNKMSEPKWREELNYYLSNQPTIPGVKLGRSLGEFFGKLMVKTEAPIDEVLKLAQEETARENFISQYGDEAYEGYVNFLSQQHNQNIES